MARDKPRSQCGAGVVQPRGSSRRRLSSRARPEVALPNKIPARDSRAHSASGASSVRRRVVALIRLFTTTSPLLSTKSTAEHLGLWTYGALAAVQELPEILDAVAVLTHLEALLALDGKVSSRDYRCQRHFDDPVSLPKPGYPNRPMLMDVTSVSALTSHFNGTGRTPSNNPPGLRQRWTLLRASTTPSRDSHHNDDERVARSKDA